MSTHFIYPLSSNGDYYFETKRGKELQINPENYWANALKGARDTWGLSTGFRLIGPGDWVWAYFTKPTAQILGVGVVKNPVAWNAMYGRHSIDIQWDAKLTAALKLNPIPYERYQQQVQSSAVRANSATRSVLEHWLATHGSSAITAQRAVEFAAREVRQRLGQGAFRANALRAYNNSCAFSGCQEPSVLQAAHIVPVGAGGSHDLSNALLLRADLHNLFDLGQITVSADLRIVVHPEVADPTYRRLHGKSLHLPTGITRAALKKGLASHRRTHSS